MPYDRYIPLERSDLAKAQLRKAVLASPEAVEQRWRSLHKATFMGNVREEKVHVYLQGEKDTVYRVDTTLWACTAEWVVFKDSVRIPVDQVIRVEFYHSSDE
ncbi:MAG: hypothetical protein EBZ22_05405 [Flavobacteriia bacterium]|jgi:hypothetical protein|nr:hypothetical protein [Flavobacteriia bacterium]